MKRLFRKILAFLILPVSMLATILMIPTPREFNYHFIKGDCYQHGSWIYDRIAHKELPIDVAFIGTSHTIHAFNEPIIEQELIGCNLTNLGYCRGGRNLHYVILKDLLKHKDPKLVVIEICEDETKNSHDIFPNIAKIGDLICTRSAINQDYFSDLYTGFMTKLEAVKQTYLFNLDIPPPVDKSKYGYGPSDRIAPAEELEDNLRAWKRRLSKLKHGRIRNTQLDYPRSYLKAMLKLLDNRNIPYCFVYLSESGSRLEKPIDFSYYEKLAPVHLPPYESFQNPKLWMDATHLNNDGAKILSEWMAKELKQNYCLDDLR